MTDIYIIYIYIYENSTVVLASVGLARLRLAPIKLLNLFNKAWNLTALPAQHGLGL